MKDAAPTNDASLTPPPDATADTRHRLLEAGMHEFAEHGIDASVRQICKRAEANAAAVNYHFGNKQRFYAEVLVTCHHQAVARRPMPRLTDDPEHPDVILRRWIRWFLELLLFEGTGSPLGRLMAREMFAPTNAFDELVKRALFPLHQELSGILLALIGPMDPLRLRLCIHSVLGQCLIYKHAEHAMERLGRLAAEIDLSPPDVQDLADHIELLAQHIADFSLAGLNGPRSHPPTSGDHS